MADRENDGQRQWVGRLAMVLVVLAAAACLGALALSAGIGLAVRGLPGLSPVAVLATPDLQPILPDESVTETPATAAGPAELLAVQDADGNIFTVQPDGAGRRLLTSDASPQHLYRQPTWSPDGASLAWSEVLTEGGRNSSALYIQRLDEAIADRIETGGYAPFYIYWSPDSRRVAFLSNWERELALRSVAVGGSARTVSLMAQGQPLYFAWAPDSTRLFAHIGSDQLSVYDVDGRATPVGASPGDFTAPAWLPDDTLLYVVRAPGRQHLVLGTPEGRELKELATADGQISFVPDSAGRRVAYAVTRLQVPTNAFGPLSVVDVQGGEIAEITREPVIAFFWSPDGRSLAYLAPDGPEQEQASSPVTVTNRAQHEGVWLRWHLWHGGESRRLSRFIPSDTYLLEYLRFFDQYALSMTPWSPDGSALVYAGSDGDGPDAIWVQPVTGNEPPRRVVAGVYAAWSPH